MYIETLHHRPLNKDLISINTLLPLFRLHIIILQHLIFTVISKVRSPPLIGTFYAVDDHNNNITITMKKDIPL